ncbi:hypothetical protein PGTUg99_016917 [Puccinia graminis f. sp. tritici]|uniref:Uncharacterized protein n=1 Tax=Puccinia graminis f. sp. tritici TaxID=56615 RepID=A0A5B0RDZ9_PUCGR|nr:hypothetical protein PGTUg99_016917 [Puccinia graminis f. sp. tritici]
MLIFAAAAFSVVCCLLSSSSYVSGINARFFLNPSSSSSPFPSNPPATLGSFFKEIG